MPNTVDETKVTSRDALRAISRALDEMEQYPARTNGRAQAKRALVNGIDKLIEAKIKEAMILTETDVDPLTVEARDGKQG